MEDANHFALKGLTAYYGERVKPDNIYKRHLPMNHVVTISNNYDDLLKILSTEIQDMYPQLVAEAQVKFDCWVESEEDGLTRQAKSCKDRFLTAKDRLFAITNADCFKCKNKKSTQTQVKISDKITEFNGKHLTIPKWPNMPLIRNNPPQPVIIAKDDISKDLQSINEYIKRIESSLNYLKANQQTTKIIRDSKGKETVIFSDPNNATKSDINELRRYLEKLQSQLNELKAKNTNGDFEKLEEQILALSEQIDNIEIPDCCSVEAEEEEEEYNTMDEDEYMEEEIFSAPSDLLPFEIFFDWDKDNVDYKFLPQLKDISDKALSSKETIIIQGHTDSSGNAEYNKKLSDRRAKAVGKIIQSYGIPASKITLQAMGSSEPKIPTAAGIKKAENRRVVIK